MMHATTRPTTKRSRPEVWKHGANCYVNHGCRCAICTNGAREARARYARRPRLESAPGRVVLEADDEDLEDDDLEDDDDDLEDDDEDDDDDEEIDD